MLPIRPAPCATLHTDRLSESSADRVAVWRVSATSALQNRGTHRASAIDLARRNGGRCRLMSVGATSGLTGTGVVGKRSVRGTNHDKACAFGQRKPTTNRTKPAFLVRCGRFTHASRENLINSPRQRCWTEWFGDDVAIFKQFGLSLLQLESLSRQ